MHFTDPGVPRRLRFGVFEFDARAGELRKAGDRLRIAGQPLRVLERLLARAPDVVTRDELRQELWPADTFVDFEHNLNSAVKRLRAALGDSAEAPRFIETLPRRGYRFLAPVTIAAPPAPPDRGQAGPGPESDPTRTGVGPGSDAGRTGSGAASDPRTTRPRWPMAAALGAIIAAGLVGWPVFRGGDGGRIASMAVLPFENLSGDASQDYFADGMTEALIASLAQIKPLKVISRTSVMRYRGVARRLPEIAQELAVDAIVEGSVVRDGDRVRITAQLIHAASDRHLWSATYDRHLRDVLALQGEVAREIARQVRVTLSPPEQARLARADAVDPAAFEAYLKARYFWNQRTPEGLDHAIGYFNEALSHDPRYAAARAGLADAFNLVPRYGGGSTRELLLTAKEHALAALEIDPDLAEAHVSLAYVQHSLDWNWAGSEASFRRSIELRPGYATAHHWYSVFLLSVGRVDEAVDQALRARELDPLSQVINLHVGWAYYLADRPDEALVAVERALHLNPDYANAYRLRGWVHLRQGRHARALASVRRSIALEGEHSENLSTLGVIEAVAGRAAEARRILARLEDEPDPRVSGQQIVWVLTALGEEERVWPLVERDFENRSVCFYLFHLQNHWLMAPLRSDPRLHALFARAGLPPPGTF